MSGKRKKETKKFYIGKNIKSDEARSPVKGSPNTNLDFYDKKSGTFLSRRKFGNDGNAQKDIDKGHSDHNKEDHVHDYKDSKRLGDRNLSKKERRELQKAKKKRRFWKND